MLKGMVLHGCVNIISASRDDRERRKLITALAFYLLSTFYLKSPINALLRMYSFILHDTPER